MIVKNARVASKYWGQEAEILEMKDLTELATTRINFTAAIAIDSGVKCMGRIPAFAEITTWITTSLLESES